MATFADTAFISFSKQARPYSELVAYLTALGIDTPRIHSTSTLMTIMRMSIEGLGIGVLPVATVRDAVEAGNLERLTLEEPLPPMIYDAIWRRSNYPSFCASVARLAKQCAADYAQDHGKLSSPTTMKGYVDT